MRANDRPYSPNPYFSTIIPAKDAEDTLSRAVESLLVQDEVAHEILIIENGSSDGTLAIAKHYEMIDSRVHAFHLDEANISDARNHGLDQARGEYILFCDADDWYLPFALSRLHEALNESRVDLLISFAEFQIIRNSGELIPIESSSLIKSAFFTGVGLSETKPYIIGETIPLARPWGIAYRRSFIENHRLKFDPRCRTLQDYIFNMDCITNDCFAKVLDCAVYHYTFRPNSNCRQNNASMVKNIADFILVFLEKLKTWKLDSKQMQEAHIFTLDRIILFLFSNMGIEQAEAVNDFINSFMNQTKIQTLLTRIVESNPCTKDIRRQLYHVASTSLLERDLRNLIAVNYSIRMLNRRDFHFRHVRNNLRLSVICHLYNSEEKLIHLVDSFRNQKISDIEMIIIDDRGGHDSMEILRDIVLKDRRIKILTNRTHLGAAASYNAGMAFAHGKYLLFTDENDKFENSILEKLLRNRIEERPTHIPAHTNKENHRFIYRRDILIGRNNRFKDVKSNRSPILCDPYERL